MQIAAAAVKKGRAYIYIGDRLIPLFSLRSEIPRNGRCVH